MIIRENVPISELVTMRIGGNARYVFELESLSEISELLSEYFIYEICEEVIDICYLQKKDKLYFGAVPFGVETVTTIFEDRIYKENDCWIYEVDVECRDSVDNSIIYTDTPVFKLVKQNKDWVFDSFSIYDTLLKYE